MLDKTKILKWLRNESNEIEYIENDDKIKESNLNFYILFNHLMIGLLVAIYISTYFSDYAKSLKPIYTIFICFSITELILNCLIHAKSNRWIACISYFGIAKAYLFGIFTSVIFNREDTGVTFLVFLIIIPVCFLFRPRIMYGIQIFISIVYCVLSFYLKSEEIASADIFNCVLFLVISILIAGRIGRLRISNISMAKNEHLHSVSLENQRNLLSVALISANMCAWEYDSTTRNLTPTYTPELYSGYNVIKYNIPDSVISENLVHEDSIETIKNMFNMTIAGRKNIQSDIHIRSSENAEYKWFRIRMIAENGQKDKFTRYIGTSEDITDRKKLESQYQEQLEILDSANESNLITKGRWNLSENRLGNIEQKGMKGIEIAEDDTFDKTIQIFLNSVYPVYKRNEISEKLNIEQIVKEYKNGVNKYDFEYQRITKDDYVIWVNMQIRVCQVPGKEEIMCFIFSYDITEEVFNRNIISRLVALGYDFLGTVYLNTRKSIVHSMQDDLLENENIADAYMKPMDYIESITKDVRATVIEDEQEEVLEKMSIENVVAHLENNNKYMILFSTNEDGKIKRKKLEYSYLDDTKETLIYYRSDITEVYKQEQEQLQKVKEALKQVEEANAAKTDFLSRMSHDIRTPMNAIIGMTHLAKEEERLEVVREYLENIGTSSDFLLGLINDILDLSKIESGELKLKLEPCKVEEFENSVNMIIRPLMEKKNIEFVFEMNCGAKCLLIDKLRFKQIFFNLLSNAVKFTPEGGKVEFIAKHLPAKNGKYGARYIVRDNGIGMSEKFIPHMFEAFSQERDIQSAHTTGSGLGLPIVKSLVDAMDGTIVVNSKKGEGTEYLIDIYCEEVNAEEDTEKNVDKNSSLEGARILLAEDNDMNILVAKRLLEKEGSIVTVAHNGQEAFDTFMASETNYFDAILMDVRMPILDGISATIKIREQDRSDAKDIPVIAMTADAFTEEKKKTLASGMNYHLSKPIDPKVMFSVLKKYIKNK